MLGSWEIVLILILFALIVFSYIFTYKRGVKKGILIGELKQLKENKEWVIKFFILNALKIRFRWKGLW